jgi:RNA polymerase sigma-70 factor (sigma-E family)
MGDAGFVEFAGSRLAGLRRAAYLLCGDWDRGDDLVQRALTDLYVHWGRASRADNIDAYARTVLVHRFIDDQRRGWSKVHLVAIPLERGAAPADDAARRLDVRAALARLAPRQRAALVLRFLCDMSVEDTAAALNCSTGTVKSQTANGLATMRRLLDAPGDRPTTRRTP